MADWANQIARLRAAVTPPVEAMGYELVHLEWSPARENSLLRIYIDAPGGIRISDCEAVSRQLSAVLDVLDDALLDSAYKLEVSSPGLARPLVTPAHFRRFIGARARIKMRESDAPHASRAPHESESPRRQGWRNFCGKLVDADARQVVLEENGERHELRYADIAAARLAPEF